MPENTNIEVAVATVSNAYGLDTAEFSKMLEILGCITPEQKNTIMIYSTAWAAKDMMENKMRAG